MSFVQLQSKNLIWPVREIKTNIIFINHLASCDYSYYSDCIIQTCAGFLSLLSFAQTCKSSTSYFSNSRDKLMIITRTDWKYRTSAQSPERMSTFIPNKTHTKVNKSTQSSEIWDKDMYQCMSVLNKIKSIKIKHQERWKQLEIVLGAHNLSRANSHQYWETLSKPLYSWQLNTIFIIYVPHNGSVLPSHFKNRIRLIIRNNIKKYQVILIWTTQRKTFLFLEILNMYLVHFCNFHFTISREK